MPAKIAVSLTSYLCTVDALYDWPDGVLPSGQRWLLSGMRYSTAGIFSALSAYPGNTPGVQRLAGAIFKQKYRVVVHETSLYSLNPIRHPSLNLEVVRHDSRTG